MTDTSGSEVQTTIRPMVGTLSNRYGVSAVCLILPPILTLYALTIWSGRWPYVLLLHLVVSATVLLLSRGLHRAKIEISRDGFTETDLFSAPVRTPRKEIASIMIIPVTDGNSTSTFDQLFVRDQHGVTRLRLRGQLWGESAVDSVARAFDVPVTRVEAPKTMADLRLEIPSHLYWHERHPYLRASAYGIGIVVLFGPILWFVQALI